MRARRPIRRALRLAVLLSLAAGWTAVRAGAQAHKAEPVVREQIVFLYYKDLAVADRFFGTTLGLKKTTDEDWVKIFSTVAGSSIGAVKEGRGSLTTAPQKPVMVSWVVDDVAQWHDRLAKLGVKIVKPLHDSTDPAMRSFLFEDPTGYTFELIQWLKPRQPPPEVATKTRNASKGFPS
jgi:lactoylglutathione lyase